MYPADWLEHGHNGGYLSPYMSQEYPTHWMESKSVYSIVQPLTKNELAAITLYNQGVAIHNSGNYMEALDTFNKSIDLKQAYPEAWNGKGRALINLGRYNEALEAFNKTIELNQSIQSNADAWLGKGNAFYGLSSYFEAIRAYDKVIEINSEDYYAWIGKGIAFCELGQLGEAKNAMDKAYGIMQRKIR
jgi:tetratricopeptide (TPR) repeat protein